MSLGYFADSLRGFLCDLGLHLHSHIVWCREDGVTIRELRECRCGHRALAEREFDATAW